MFTKLLKYEFRAQRKLLSILSLSALGAGIIGGLMMWLITGSDVIYGSFTTENDFAAAMLISFSTTLMLGAIFAIIAYIVAVYILLLYRFYKHHFSDEGYLTFTLPATTHQILLSSILNIIIWSFICIVVAILAYIMLFAPIIHMAMQEIQQMQGFMPDISYNIFPDLGAGQLVLGIFYMIATSLYSLILPLLSITLGALVAKKHKILASFGIYYGLSAVLSVITGIIQIFSVVSDVVVSAESNSLYLTFSYLIPSLLYLGIGIGGYFLMHRLVSRKLNLP